jgi:hypothetical protein
MPGLRDINRQMGTIQGTDAAIEVRCERVARQDVLRDGDVTCREVHECRIDTL